MQPVKGGVCKRTKHYCDKADKLFTTGSLINLKKTLFMKA